MGYNYDDQSSAIPRGSKIRICLFLFLNIFANIACEDGLDNFLETVMDNFEPVAPTVIIGEAIPEFCMMRKWLLCLKYSQDESSHIAKHLKTLHLTGKQDMVIFAGSEG